MSKPRHTRRTRPRPAPLKQRQVSKRIAADRRALRELDHWRRAN